ncbi:MAG: alaS [Bacillales bacterium]|jgi:alanyl-tRNA synthetase|nr:alaS [Bacillales bacterium]
MKKMTGAEVRQMFLDYFVQKGHVVEPSASLVPVNDPTLLWINSGVATLKKYFDGSVIPENPRIVNSQKAIRTNDIENVGITARHHTFFEMLGNFSIGDYFREEAMAYWWELITSPEWFGFEKEKLYVTVYPEDKDSYNNWVKMGLDEDHIIKLEGNFWEIGEGPCGPCTEIFYDRGLNYDPENIGIRLLVEDLENDRYLEIGNIVLSQYNSKDGLARSEYPELPTKNIDTGMGLERMVSIIQEGETNYDTDLFLPMIHCMEKLSGKKYRAGSLDQDTAFKVVADHIRTVTFAVSDGALPSNEGRGYILRRLIRRSVRYAKKLGIEKPFMFELVPVVAEIMESYYPNVKENIPFVQKVIKGEEDRFHETLNGGLEILSEVIKNEKANGSDTINGKVAFKLYDTFGFPIELTEEYASDENMKIDREGFNTEMEEQRERARNARHDVESMKVQGGILGELKDESKFIGYDQLETEGKILYILKDGEPVQSASRGDVVQIMLDQTSFYAESGGQIADLGMLSNLKGSAEVTDVQKAPNGQPLHSVKIVSNTLTVGETVSAKVDPINRGRVTKNHTATHLLHQALKDVLGSHVNQAGSQVSAERLRFDFSHISSVTTEELEKIEQIVNEKIWATLDLNISNKQIAEAKAMGAMALFGEKYGDVVRVVKVGDYSLELCGGCHVTNTSSIGLFKIASEAGIGAGTRRIEAVTGQAAYELLTSQVNLLKDTAEKVKANIKDLPVKIDAVLAELREVHRENESLKTKLGNIEAKSLESKAIVVNGITVLAAKVNAQDMNTLRSMVDELRIKLPSSVIVLGSANSDKVNLITAVSGDNIAKGIHAGNIIKQIAQICGGSGGGRPDMAQAGGKNPEKLDLAISEVAKILAM